MVSQLLLSSALLVLTSAGNAGTLSDTAAFIQASVNYKPPEKKVDHEKALQMIRDRLEMVKTLTEQSGKLSPEVTNMFRDRMQMLKNSTGKDKVDPAVERMRRALKALTGKQDFEPQDKVDPVKVAMNTQEKVDPVKVAMNTQEKVDPVKVAMNMLVDHDSVSKDTIKKAALEAAKSIGKHTVINTLRKKTPFGLGKVIVNDKEKDQVHRCSDISSSLYCGMSEKVYGISCVGWGGSSCLDASASCDSITVEGICRHSIERLNVTCLGWGGHRCLPYGATANLITTEPICQASEAKLGIRSLGWSGSACLDKQTVSCEKISVPGICNDAAVRLGIDCAGWGGSKCFSRGAMTCRRITAQHLCSSALKRFHMNCTWHRPGRCTDAIA